MRASRRLVHSSTHRRVRDDRGHQETSWDRQVVLEAAREQPQAEPEQAQVAPVAPMQALQPAITQDTDSQIDQPQLG